MGRNRKEPLADIPLQEQASREKVLKTAVRMLQEIGYQRTTLRRISAESGVGEGELRRWYKTKDELLAAISEMLLVRGPGSDGKRTGPFGNPAEGKSQGNAGPVPVHCAPGHSPGSRRLKAPCSAASAGLCTLPPGCSSCWWTGMLLMPI